MKFGIFYPNPLLATRLEEARARAANVTDTIAATGSL